MTRAQAIEYLLQPSDSESDVDYLSAEDEPLEAVHDRSRRPESLLLRARQHARRRKALNRALERAREIEDGRVVYDSIVNIANMATLNALKPRLTSETRRANSDTVAFAHSIMTKTHNREDLRKLARAFEAAGAPELDQPAAPAYLIVPDDLALAGGPVHDSGPLVIITPSPGSSQPTPSAPSVSSASLSASSPACSSRPADVRSPATPVFVLAAPSRADGRRALPPHASGAHASGAPSPPTEAQTRARRIPEEIHQSMQHGGAPEKAVRGEEAARGEEVDEDPYVERGPEEPFGEAAVVEGGAAGGQTTPGGLHHEVPWLPSPSRSPAAKHGSLSSDGSDSETSSEQSSETSSEQSSSFLSDASSVVTSRRGSVEKAAQILHDI